MYINTYYRILSCFTKDYYEDKNIIYNKTKDFSYHKGYNSVNRFLNKNLFSAQELNIISQNLTKLEKYCSDNGVDLYIILSNDKESIYPEYYPTYYKQNQKLSRLEQTKLLLKEFPNLKVISQAEKLLEEKDSNLLFEPYDTHLNNYGSYIEYKTIVTKLQEKYPFLSYVKINEIDFGKSNKKGDSLPPKKYINKNFEYVDKIIIKNSLSEIRNSITIKSTSQNYNLFDNHQANNHIKMVIIGDSFHARYLQLLAETFYSVKSLFVGDGKSFTLDNSSKEILFYEKPDILLIETTERFLQRFLELDSLFDIFNYSKERGF